MSFYIDAKRKVYPVDERVIENENRAEAEEEIVAELYKIFLKK